MKNVLVATEKPFSKEAVDEIRKMSEKAGYKLTLLEKYTDPADFKKAVSAADALIIRSDKATREIIESGKNLKIIVRAGAGYDNIDLSAATDKGVVAMNTPGQNSNAVAELALGMMVYTSRSMFSGKAGTELRGKTLGIHAYGNVGRYVAEIAKGFGMMVSAFDPFVSDEVIAKDGVKVVKSAEALYQNNQFISLNIPANDQTKKSINLALLSTMPKGATLINTARKEVVNEDDLLKAFADRDDFRYLADIAPDCASEIADKYPNRFFFTPKKMGAQTAEANLNAGIAAITQIINFFENGDRTFQVNK